VIFHEPSEIADKNYVYVQRTIQKCLAKAAKAVITTIRHIWMHLLRK
jgi:hypothetical protein